MTAKPNKILFHKKSRRLEVGYADGSHFDLPCEYLRVWSPSAEVRGHGGEPIALPGKANVTINAIEPVGNYAVRLRFDDGHDSGLYSWDVLWDLGQNQTEYWQDYLKRLEASGKSRDPDAAPEAGGVKKYGLREARLRGQA